MLGYKTTQLTVDPLHRLWLPTVILVSPHYLPIAFLLKSSILCIILLSILVGTYIAYPHSWLGTADFGIGFVNPKMLFPF